MMDDDDDDDDGDLFGILGALGNCDQRDMKGQHPKVSGNETGRSASQFSIRNTER